MAVQSDSDLIMLGADDAVMQTQDWDQIVRDAVPESVLSLAHVKIARRVRACAAVPSLRACA